MRPMPFNKMPFLGLILAVLAALLAPGLDRVALAEAGAAACGTGAGPRTESALDVIDAAAGVASWKPAAVQRGFSERPSEDGIELAQNCNCPATHPVCNYNNMRKETICCASGNTRCVSQYRTWCCGSAYPNCNGDGQSASPCR